MWPVSLSITPIPPVLCGSHGHRDTDRHRQSPRPAPRENRDASPYTKGNVRFQSPERHAHSSSNRQGNFSLAAIKGQTSVTASQPPQWHPRVNACKKWLTTCFIWPDESFWRFRFSSFSQVNYWKHVWKTGVAAGIWSCQRCFPNSHTRLRFPKKKKHHAFLDLYSKAVQTVRHENSPVAQLGHEVATCYYVWWGFH